MTKDDELTDEQLLNLPMSALKASGFPPARRRMTCSHTAGGPSETLYRKPFRFPAISDYAVGLTATSICSF